MGILDFEREQAIDAAAAAEAEAKAEADRRDPAIRRTATTGADPRVAPSEGSHVFQSYIKNSPTLIGFGQFSSTIQSSTFVRIDSNGNRVYKIALLSPWGTVTTHLWATEGNSFVQPSGDRVADPVRGDGDGGATALNQKKEQWHQWVANMVSNGSIMQTTALGYSQQIDRFNGTAYELDQLFNFIRVNSNFGAPGGDAGFEPIYGQSSGDPFASIGSGGGGGGGGGGGFLEPEYVAPDRRVIEDLVKGMMVSLVGTVTGDLDRITDIYMDVNKGNFDDPTKFLDPSQSVVEAIRGTRDYEVIHQNRPESQDERTWISNRRFAAEQGGLTVSLLEDFAITQATTAGDIADVREAAGFRQLATSGQAPDIIQQKIESAAQSLFAGVVR